MRSVRVRAVVSLTAAVPAGDLSPVTPRERDELLGEIEGHFKSLWGPGVDPARAERWLAFEMSSVEVHRRNLVPFVRGHGVGAGDRVLDYGSGPGCSACALAVDLGARVTGIEPRRESRRIAALWAEAYGVGDLVAFAPAPDVRAFPDESFDFVLASSVLEYISGDRGAHLREMWRVLRPGGRLLVAGTSNGVWPREAHSKTWLVNWMPNLGPRIRRALGRNPDVERGVTFGEIEACLPGARFVRGESDELAAFAGRLFGRGADGAGLLPALGRRFVTEALAAFDRRVFPALGWPAEAWLPWLNVAFERSG